MDSGRATDVTYLNFTKVFDSVLHNILLSKLEIQGVDGWTVQMQVHYQEWSVEISDKWCPSGVCTETDSL